MQQGRMTDPQLAAHLRKHRGPYTYLVRTDVPVNEYRDAAGEIFLIVVFDSATRTRVVYIN